MTGPDHHTTPEAPALRQALAEGAESLAPSAAPYAAIVHGGRRLRRRRTTTRAALALTAVLVPALGLTLLPDHRTAPAAGPASGSSATPGSPDRRVDAAAPGVKFEAPHDPNVPNDVRMTKLQGKVSGVTGEVLVWLPPQYDDPAYRDKTFPVVELLPGRPAAPDTWFSTLGASTQLAPFAADGSALPFVLVAPQTSHLAGESDNGCADLPGGPKAESWLTRDVPQFLLDHFRVRTEARHWALAGYAGGGHCAARLALEHPDRYGAAASLSGYNDPAEQPSSPVGQDPTRRTQADLLTLIHRTPTLPLYTAGAPGDGLEDAQALAAASPTTVTVQPLTTAHDPQAWTQTLPNLFKWLTSLGR
ncbi:esterase [Kitasatospora sp. MMS16-BH015]|uniref:alpha/beta hydrolase n=1 Tax=Kitasatospora sp. MMS16-BH015 TaxID=2018025 RepID=UPI000CA1A11D|nr:alpha/beta hydrolase-fold protein [Kitasatospora sp. MMS16-BH015]AUG78421.1 esterase [Kitasatospora sp. MMS16-BH015]